ncbi:hypothetical protein ACWEOO_29380 [Kribbella sp. NPDC004138]
MRKLSITLGTAVLAAATTVVGAASANAESTPTESEFGQHVAGCAQTMGFDGVHNPGMHQGFSGWDGMPC